MNMFDYADQQSSKQVGRFRVTSVPSDTASDWYSVPRSQPTSQSIVGISEPSPPKVKRFRWASMLDITRRGRDTDPIQSSTDQKVHKTQLSLYEEDLCDMSKTVGTVLRTTDEDDEDKATKANLGTFLGVFLPCCQNIVGVIFFVRFPWIIGTAGVIEGLVIVGMCSMVSICTAISISAIATNGKVTAGGTYFMISRSLGPGFGGSVGILFFMGTSISVAMYYIGTVETLLNYIAPQMRIFSNGMQEDPGRFHDYRVYGSILLLTMGVLVFVGVVWVQRFAFCAIIFLLAALISIYSGVVVGGSRDEVIMICKLGNRPIIYKLAHDNESWQCNKTPGGPLYAAYCVNGSCEDYFERHNAVLSRVVSTMRLAWIAETLYNSYTDKGDIIGHKGLDANQEREVVTDISTSFVFLMGIYFPSITGVESGSNYSGDLEFPQRAIPLGTLLAVTVTTTIYMLSVVVFAGVVDGDVLRDKYGMSVSLYGDMVISLIAWPSKWVVLVGTLTATIGAGLQALAGGPRLLQAIAEDGIYPSLAFFAKKWNGEPRRCLVVTFLIALTGILIARLDNVAHIVTMFFLMCYGFVNFAVTLQSLLDLPHWRPAFHFYHWSVTLLGSSLCLTIMFMTKWQYALIAVTLAFCLYQYIEYKGAEKEWGDGMTGLSMSAAIFALSRLKRSYRHTKSWRPQLLVLLKSISIAEGTISEEDLRLVCLSAMLQSTGRGFCMYGTVLQGKLSDQVYTHEEMKAAYGELLEKYGVKRFVEVVVAPNVSDGLCCMIQSAGLGPLRPNTIVLGWPNDWMHNRNILAYHVFLDTMRNIAMTENAVLVLKAENFPSQTDRVSKPIDVWWIVNDGGMLILIAHLLTRHKTYSKCHIRVFAVAEEDESTSEFQDGLQAYLYDLRVNATVEVVEMKLDDISAYVYERTLKMEERTRMLEMITKTKRQRFGKVQDSQSSLLQAAANRSSFDILTSATTSRGVQKPLVPSEKNMRNMTTAIQLNTLMKEKSSQASLIILNLPSAPESTQGQANYMSFLEVLTEGLDRLILVRGTGREVITIFN